MQRQSEEEMDSSKLDTLSDENVDKSTANWESQARQQPKQHFCNKCGIVQPYRTKHCRICQCCVAKFDHHCFWIGGCVGELNHRRFISMLGLMTPAYWFVTVWVGWL